MRNLDLGKAVDLWISDRPSKARLGARWLMASYHHRLPREFRVFGFLHLTTKTALASSAPALAHLVYGSITAPMAAVASAVIIGGHAAVGFFDRLSRERHSSHQADQTESFVRVGELLRMCAPVTHAQADRDDMLRSALGIIENFARQVTRARRGEISVSIALYSGNSSTKMQIRHRNPGNTRPIGRTFDGVGVLGHHACQNGTGPKIVHNLKRMHKSFRKSPTNSQVVYQSFLILPLVVAREGQERIGGFLSIDATRPYTFYGSRGTVLIVNCEPVIEHIQKLL